MSGDGSDTNPDLAPGGLDWDEESPVPGLPGAEPGPAVAGVRGGAAAGEGDSGPPAVRWRRWRRTRPFWGGALVIAGATVTLLSERAPLPLIVHIGIQGMAGYLVPVLLLLCGLLLWFNPAQKTFYSIVAVLLALGSWITSNLGGFFIGMLSGVIGGCLGFAWERLPSQPATRPAPPPPPPPTPAPPRPTPGLSIILNPEPQPQPQPEPEARTGPEPQPGPVS